MKPLNPEIILSDETLLGLNTWADIKHEAMQLQYEELPWFVSDYRLA